MNLLPQEKQIRVNNIHPPRPNLKFLRRFWEKPTPFWPEYLPETTEERKQPLRQEQEQQNEYIHF